MRDRVQKATRPKRSRNGGGAEKVNEIAKIIPAGRGMLRTVNRVCQGDLPRDRTEVDTQKDTLRALRLDASMG